MAKIKPKLNLNKTPQAVENYSLVMAHNIAVDDEGAIVPDYSIKCIKSFEKYKDNNGNVGPNNIITIISGLNSCMYIFYYELDSNNNKVYKIGEYDEIMGTIIDIKCGWTYSGGEITGNVTVNNTNEYILNICESCDDKNIPIKHINLSKCKATDDESIYTQNPKIPITNLHLRKTYTKNIPNGVYQFFVRYRIRDDFYTGWFPCSKECFAGIGETIKTVQGQLKYVYTNRDSAKSFIFEVEHIFNGATLKSIQKEDYTKLYKDYQIGFILSTNDSMIARSWKSFDFGVSQIKFDYAQSAIEEIDIEDMLSTNYEIFNVKNIAYFKNKQYISNYKETDFNPNLKSYADRITVELKQHAFTNSGTFIDGIELSGQTTQSGLTYYTNWGSKDAKDLFNNKVLVNKNRSESKIGNTIDSAGLQHGLYEYNLHWDATVNPDLMWINKGTKNSSITSTFPLANFNKTNQECFQQLFALCNHIPPHVVSANAGEQYAIIRDYDYNHPWDDDYDFKNEWFFLSGANGNVLIPSKSQGPFPCCDSGFNGQYQSINKKTVDSLSDNFGKSTLLGNNRIIAAYVISNNTNYYIYGASNMSNINNPYNFDGNYASGRQEADDYYIEQLLINSIIGVTDDGKFVADINNVKVEFDKYYIVYSNYEYYCSDDSAATLLNDKYDKELRIDVKRTNYTIIKSCFVADRHINTNNSNDEKQYTTLLPFTEYEFYVHYVQQNGIITNGYKINHTVSGVNFNGAILNRNRNYPNGRFIGTNYNCIIYPEFTNIIIPNGYVSCFFSIYKTGNDICKGFNHELRNDGYHYLDCLEADALLYNLKNKICIINSNGYELTSGGESVSEEVRAVDATYYSSSDFTPVEMLGNSGCIRWKRNAITDAILYETISGDKTVTIPNEGGVLALYINGGDNGIGESVKTFTIPANTDITSAYVTTIRNTLWQIYDVPDRIHYCRFELGKPGSTQRDIKFVFNTQYWANITIAGTAITENKISDIGFGFATTAEEAIRIAKGTATRAAHPIVGDELWVKINNTYDINKDRQLIKITPFIDFLKLKQVQGTLTFYYDNYEDLNLPGYLCKVYKPNRNYSNNIYVSGADIYTKDTSDADSIKIDMYYNYANLNTSNPAYILSNFNLNYVSLAEDINPQLRTFKLDPDAEGTSYMQLIKALNSLTASFILQLESMYKNYNRKYFYIYEDKKHTEFDNTIRSSDTNIDEVYRNIYKFYPEDYYNVPVNRGKIVNMFAVLNEIYVHCQHSLFKFAGNNTLSANGGEVSLQESNVFDTGIVEIFDSQYGYAGIQEKHHSLITFNYYFFYDAYVNKLYAYDTTSGIKEIGNSINNFIKSIIIKDVRFAEDTFHDRIFINFICDNGGATDVNVNISFNFKTNSFASIHDFTFRKAFNSRNYTYFILENYITTQNVTTHYDNFLRINKYEQLHMVTTTTTTFENYDILFKASYIEVDSLMSHRSNVAEVPCCIDIIYNDQYELIKIFNEVSWICGKGNAYLDTYSKNLANDKNEVYPGKAFRIYSDQTYSNEITYNGLDMSNDISLQGTFYNKVRYNNGIFTLNCLRDSNSVSRIDPQNAAIHGKYFVFRIIFTNYKFRIENIKINCENYEKA